MKERIPLEKGAEITTKNGEIFKIIDCIGGGYSSLVYLAEKKSNSQIGVIKELYLSDEAVSEATKTVVIQKRDGMSIVPSQDGKKYEEFMKSKYVLFRENAIVSNSFPRKSDEPLSDYFFTSEYILFEEEKGFLWMQTNNGKVLLDYIYNNKLAYKEIVGFSIRLLKAVRCMHENNKIHGDIKSLNCFVTLDPSDNKPIGLKLIDLGEAFDVEDIPVNFSGSDGYTPVFKGKLGHKSADIYSVSAVIYEMIVHDKTSFLRYGKLSKNDLKSSVEKELKNESFSFVNDLSELLWEMRNWTLKDELSDKILDELIANFEELLDRYLNETFSYQAGVFVKKNNQLVSNYQIDKNILPVVSCESKRYDNLFSAIESKPANIYFHGIAGSGKTFSMLNLVAEIYKSSNETVVPVFLPLKQYSKEKEIAGLLDECYFGSNLNNIHRDVVEMMFNNPDFIYNSKKVSFLLLFEGLNEIPVEDYNNFIYEVKNNYYNFNLKNATVIISSKYLDSNFKTWNHIETIGIKSEKEGSIYSLPFFYTKKRADSNTESKYEIIDSYVNSTNIRFSNRNELKISKLEEEIFSLARDMIYSEQRYLSKKLNHDEKEEAYLNEFITCNNNKIMFTHDYFMYYFFLKNLQKNKFPIRVYVKVDNELLGLIKECQSIAIDIDSLARNKVCRLNSIFNRDPENGLTTEDYRWAFPLLSMVVYNYLNNGTYNKKAECKVLMETVFYSKENMLPGVLNQIISYVEKLDELKQIEEDVNVINGIMHLMNLYVEIARRKEEYKKALAGLKEWRNAFELNWYDRALITDTYLNEFFFTTRHQKIKIALAEKYIEIVKIKDRGELEDFYFENRDSIKEGLLELEELTEDEVIVAINFYGMLMSKPNRALRPYINYAFSYTEEQKKCIAIRKSCKNILYDYIHDIYSCEELINNLLTPGVNIENDNIFEDMYQFELIREIDSDETFIKTNESYKSEFTLSIVKRLLEYYKNYRFLNSNKYNYFYGLYHLYRNEYDTAIKYFEECSWKNAYILKCMLLNQYDSQITDCFNEYKKGLEAYWYDNSDGIHILKDLYNLVEFKHVTGLNKALLEEITAGNEWAREQMEWYNIQ